MTERIPHHAERFLRRWTVTAEEVRQTPTSVLVFGKRAGEPVVLKVIRNPGDEWHSGEVLRAFDGKGVVRAYEVTGGAALLERVLPGDPLVGLVKTGRDKQATEILANVIKRMEGTAPIANCARLEDWAQGFDRYLQSKDSIIPKNLVQEARAVYLELCDSQQKRRLLHGDLHHENILLDANRGWLAIDPKGVVGELEYEIGAALRNPTERPELFASAEIVRRRIDEFDQMLQIDARRVLLWAFAQAVLSVIWCWEDGLPIERQHPLLVLAGEIRP